MNKAEAAKRLFNEMLYVLGEEELKDVSAASILKDLYDCHHCVRYIAQMYCKGIIGASEKNAAVFDLNENVSALVFKEWQERLYNKKLRIVPKPVKFEGVKFMTRSELEGKSMVNYETLVINLGEKDLLLNHAKNIKSSLQEIKLNPYGVSDDRIRPVILVCDYGIKSQLAAGILSKSGYRDITVVLP
ncbi:MAG: hypothetical protein MJ113_00725 [Lachnospiraceae bacterium]|nr:hypothetical protein [Lachnospiraceae bacterium]